jgi:hypothetical protein
MNKKILFVSQGKYPVELKCDGLGDTGFYKISADAPVSISFLHVQGTNLSQILPDDVHGANTGDGHRFLINIDKEIP